MAHMTLPAAHTEADALLAQRIGRTFGLEEVHVFWTLPVPAPATATRSAPAPTAYVGRRADLPLALISALVAIGDRGVRRGARLLLRGR